MNWRLDDNDIYHCTTFNILLQHAVQALNTWTYHTCAPLTGSCVHITCRQSRLSNNYYQIYQQTKKCASSAYRILIDWYLFEWTVFVNRLLISHLIFNITFCLVKDQAKEMAFTWTNLSPDWDYICFSFHCVRCSFCVYTFLFLNGIAF